MSLILIILSSVLAFVSYIVYIIAIFRGYAKPHRTARFCTALITILSMVSLIAQGSTVAVWLSVVFAVGSLVIFILTLWYGMGGWAKTDIVCLVISVVGILFWRATSNPMYGLIFFIGADFVGQIPMLIKTYWFPETEVWTFYFLDVLAALCSLAAMSFWVAREFAYPLYVVFLDCFIIFLILRPNREIIETP